MSCFHYKLVLLASEVIVRCVLSLKKAEETFIQENTGWELGAGPRQRFMRTVKFMRRCGLGPPAPSPVVMSPKQHSPPPAVVSASPPTSTSEGVNPVVPGERVTASPEAAEGGYEV